MTNSVSESKSKDHWSTKTYSEAAGFVPKLAQKVVQWLDPQPRDRILDVGCGDGKFTSNFLDHVAEVYGVDASPSFIESANQDYASGKARFKVVDCRFLERDQTAVDGEWDKVVSNAALHWILRDDSTRMNTLTACYNALKPGGYFVFEMGGAGNVAECLTALTSGLYHAGLSMQHAQAANPWFFPSEAWIRDALSKMGFEIERLELEYRPTKLNTGEGGGLEGWIRLMGADMLDRLGDDPSTKDRVIQEVCQVLQNSVCREDGSQWLGYVRLRCKARKPV